MEKLFALLLVVLYFSGCMSEEEKLIKNASKIHESVLTVDTHCDTPMGFAEKNFDLGKRHEEGCVDFPRMAEGGLHAEFFAVFIGQGPRNDSAFNEVHEAALDIFRDIHENVGANSPVFRIGTP